MTFLPIVLRELRVRSRQKSTYWFRQAGAVVAIVIVTFMLMSTGVLNPGRLGATAFRVMGWLAFLYCLIEGVRNTADCLSEEKRAGTLGLLFLTDLKGYDVVLGKMIATSLNSVYVLIAILPPMAIPLLVGGVTAGEFWRLVLVLVVTMALSLSVGLCVSALSHDSQRAWTTAYLVVALLGVLAVPAVLWPALKALTPAAAFVSLTEPAYRASPAGYWVSVTGSGIMSLALFAAASLALPRVWQERPVTATGRRMPSPTRLTLLATNPVAWAAQRSSSNPVYIWTVMGGVCLAAMITMALAQGTGGAARGLLFGGVVMYVVLAVWVATEACHLFPAARQSGALELLLCTPVTVKEIVEGHFRALQRLFAGPVLLFITTVFLLLAGYIYARHMAARVYEPMLLFGGAMVAIAFLVLDLHALAHYGMWMGLKSARPGLAITRTVAFVLVLPLFLLIPCFPGVFFIPIGWIVKDLIFINYARDQITRRFRKAATEAAGIESARLLAQRLPPVLP